MQRVSASVGPHGSSGRLWRRVLPALAVIVLMAAGTTAITATPASAVPGGCNGYDTVSACIDWGYYGDSVRADFYMNRTPNDGYYSYKVFINVNGHYQEMGGGRLDHTGRYCCWYRRTSSEPDSWYTVYSEVRVYTQSGHLHITSKSPKIRYAY